LAPESGGDVNTCIKSTEPSPPPAVKRKLLDQARDILRAKYYSRRTEEVYVGWMRRFILFHQKRHPREMGGAEVAEFLSHFLNKPGLAVRSPLD
jgi:hypothetical protein